MVLHLSISTRPTTLGTQLRNKIFYIYKIVTFLCSKLASDIIIISTFYIFIKMRRSSINSHFKEPLIQMRRCQKGMKGLQLLLLTEKFSFLTVTETYNFTQFVRTMYYKTYLCIVDSTMKLRQTLRWLKLKVFGSNVIDLRNLRSHSFFN